MTSTTRPSIAALQRLRTAMTDGEEWYAVDGVVWVADYSHPTYDMRVMLAGAATDESERAPINRRDGVANAAGTVALVNAAPVLLEIAAAALAWNEADDSMSSEVSDDEVLALRRTLREVLGKVRR